MDSAATDHGPAKQRAVDLNQLAEMIRAGAVTPTIDSAYPLERVPEAMRHLEAGQARGKIVIVV